MDGDPATRRWLTGVVVAFGLLFAVGVAGRSAAVAPVGEGAGPPLALQLHLPSALVTVLLWAAYLIGGWAVWTGLRVRRGISGSDAALGTVAVGFAALWAAPQGSADVQSYLAYGRIAALGGDPYTTSPVQWLAAHPRDAVVAGAQPPWTGTVSVYGPVGTALQTACAWLGGGHLHLSVWLWQLLCFAAYLAVVALLWSLTDQRCDTRILVLVAWNPILVGPVVFGGHIDILAMAFGLAAVRAGTRRPLVAGALGAAAMSVKLPYAVFLLGLVAAVVVQRERPRWRPALAGAFGAMVVLGVGHAWTGAHTYDQARVASSFTSLSTPWRAAVNLALAVDPSGKRLVLDLAPLAVLVAAWACFELTRRREDFALDRPRAVALRVVLIVGGGWSLAAPYLLPWYVLLLWVPLVVLAPATRLPLERVAVVLTTVLALAYVPGRVEGMSPVVQQVTLAVRSYLCPAVLLGCGTVLLWWATAERRASRATGGSPPPAGRWGRRR